MTGSLLAPIRVAMVTSAAGDFLQTSAKSLTSQGFKMVREGIDQNNMRSKLQEKMQAIPVGQGMLISFEIFTAPDGKTYAYGPTPYGVGKRPEDPLIAIGFSRKSAAEYGQSIVEAREGATGWTHSGGRYYWVAKDQAGEVRFFAANETEILRRSFTAQARAFSSAARASQGDTLTKLARQEKLFNTIETQFRDELRKTKIESRLANIRADMRQADQQIRKAKQARAKALQEAKSGQGLQNVIDLLGLAGNITSFAAQATAKANYNKTVVNNMTQKYNQNVNLYINTIQQNTTINMGLLPANPTIPLIPPLD